jgi:hypothetical protein
LTWRWTGPSTVSTLDLPLADDRDLRISVRILKVADTALLKNLKVRVNGISMPVEIFENPVSRLCVVEVPVNVLRSSPGRTRISIETEKTIKISDRYPDSYIYAGLAVSGIKVAPLIAPLSLLG